ncbi:60S ribosomal protein L36 [Schaereria dolodes]|nr:60S ribosomal protein L36 [Schaereria dolodes]
MAKERSGIAIGLNRGHKTTLREVKPRISRSKGHLSKRTQFVREIVKEVAGYVGSLSSTKTTDSNAGIVREGLKKLQGMRGMGI